MLLLLLLLFDLCFSVCTFAFISSFDSCSSKSAKLIIGGNSADDGGDIEGNNSEVDIGLIAVKELTVAEVRLVEFGCSGGLSERARIRPAPPVGILLVVNDGPIVIQLDGFGEVIRSRLDDGAT